MSLRAVEEHDGLGEFFDERYRAADADYHRYAFSYGRRKIDDLLRVVLSTVPAGGHVLDVGCGTGEQLHRCAQLGFAVSGVEPAAKLRAVAREYVPKAEIVDALAWEMPFESGSFDLVVSVEVLRYLETEDYLRSCDELARVVRPGGLVFLTLVNRWASDAYWLYYRAQQVSAALTGGKRPLHCEFTTPREVRTVLTERGFEDVRSFGCMAGFLRVFYKLGVGPTVTKALEPLDDRSARFSLMATFAGHLAVTARRSGSQ